jgi:hypothetical protein
MTATAMIHYFKPKMESIIDKGSKVTHEQLTQYVYVRFPRLAYILPEWLRRRLVTTRKEPT